MQGPKNKITGQMPGFANASALEYFSVSFNAMTGTIPDDWTAPPGMHFFSAQVGRYLRVQARGAVTIKTVLVHMQTWLGSYAACLHVCTGLQRRCFVCDREIRSVVPSPHPRMLLFTMTPVSCLANRYEQTT